MQTQEDFDGNTKEKDYCTDEELSSVCLAEESVWEG